MVKVDEWKGIWPCLKNDPTCRCLVHKTMNMCASYLTRTYLKISGASSCRCTGIARMPLPYLSTHGFLVNTLVIWPSQIGLDFFYHKKKITSFFGLVWPPIVAVEMANNCFQVTFPLSCFGPEVLIVYPKNLQHPTKSTQWPKERPLDMELKLPKIQNPNHKLLNESTS